MRALFIALALILSACASIYESDYEFQQTPFAGSTGTVAQPSNEWAQWHFACAAKLMRADFTGPYPPIRWVNRPWLNYYGEIAYGAYVEDGNAIYVVHWRRSTEVIVHEIAHWWATRLGEEISEPRARMISDWWKHCLLFPEP